MGPLMSNATLHDLRLQLTSYRTLIFALLALIVSRIAPDAGPLGLLGHLLRDLGIALLIGLYITWTLERLNTVRRNEELDDYVRTVGDNFVKAVYGREMPAGLFQIVKQSIFDGHFVRSSYTADWWLHNLTMDFIKAAPTNIRGLLGGFADAIGGTKLEGSNLIVIRFSVAYEVVNVDSVTRTYPVRWIVPKPFGGNFEGLCGITSVLINRVQQLNGVYYRTEDADAFPDSTQLNYVKDVAIAAGRSISAELEAYSVRSNDDKEQWQTLIPSEGMSMRVTDADGDKDIFLLLDAPLLEGEEAFAKKDLNTNKATLKVTQYLLPYQGVTVTWTPTARTVGLLPKTGVTE